MTWHYQIRQRHEYGGDIYDIVEVFGEDAGRFWTQNSIEPIADTAEGMVTVLEMMLADAKKYPVLVDKEPDDAS